MDNANDNLPIDGYEYNQEIINFYIDGLSHAKKEMSKDFLKIYDFNSNRTITEWKLLKRQLTQCVAGIGVKIIEPMRTGFIFADNNDLINDAYNISKSGFVELLALTKSHIEVVDQQIEKLTPINIKDTFIDRLTFEAVFIFELHKAFNEELFDNTIPQLYMALNDPKNLDYKIDFIASNKNMVYYFIDKLEVEFNKTNFGKQMCLKQGIDEKLFSTSKNKSMSGSEKEVDFVKRLDKFLRNKSKIK